MKFKFTGPVIEWRGPSPFYFVATPPDLTEEINAIKSSVSYGWGVVPAVLKVGQVSVSTSLIPRNGYYFVPLRDSIRKPNSISVGDQVLLELEI